MTRLATLRRVLIWIVAAYLTLKFVRTGAVKFDPDGFWSAPFARWGYPPWLRVGVGTAEVLGGVALLVPRVASYGAGILVAIMGGAIFTRARDGAWDDVLSNTVLVAALLWIAWERWRLRSQRGAGSA